MPEPSATQPTITAEAGLEIAQFPCLADNYGYLLHDPQSGETACIDTPDAERYLAEAERRGWRITQIWNTHWHPDHTGGNAAIKAATGCTITAPSHEAERIAGVDNPVGGGDTVLLGAYQGEVLDVGGHTLSHIAYYLPVIAHGADTPQPGAAFVGDALFPLGCGRMFEGTAEQFWTSLERLSALPSDTRLYSAHEYTEANARFALHADPDNEALAAYAEEVKALRSEDKPTVPTTLAAELACNPFLRASTPQMMSRWGGDNPAETFAALRAAKDSF